jgi:hypothetical protein
MSLILCYHERRRACVASDGRSVAFHDGEPTAADDHTSKFISVGLNIVGIVGPSDVCSRLKESFLKNFDETSGIELLAQCLPTFLRAVWESRQSRPWPTGKSYDSAEAFVLGYDSEKERMRCFVATAPDYCCVETTENPQTRIFALGAYSTEHDKQILDRLTRSMEISNKMGLPWIAAQLAEATYDLHDAHPVVIGLASYFAAIDSRGFVELPEDFGSIQTPVAFRPASDRTLNNHHHATIIKEVAIYGAGRMFVGSIMTPVAGGSDTVGNNDGGSSSPASGQVLKLGMSYAVTNGIGGSGIQGVASASSLDATVDGNSATYGTLAADGTGANNFANVCWYGPPGISGAFQSLVIAVLFAVPTNDLSGHLQSVSMTFGTQGPSGTVFTTFYVLDSPNTAALNEVTVTLDPQTNPSQVVVSMEVFAQFPDTSGSCVLQVNEVYLVATL